MKKLIALTNIAIISSLLLVGCSTSANKKESEMELSEAQAKSTVLTLANLSEDEVSSMKVEKDEEDGVQIYRVSFTSGDQDFEYEINRMTGELVDDHQDDDSTTKPNDDTLEQDQNDNIDDLDDNNSNDDLDDKDDDKPVVSKPQPTTPNTSLISENEAKNIALNHANVSAGNIRNLHIELDSDDGKKHYEVDFETSNSDYSYEIDASNGTILSHDMDIEDDHDDHKPVVSKPQPNTSIISKEEAKNIAFKHANVSESNVRNLDIELDSDDGYKYYELEFEIGNKEYSYEIEASKGTIIAHEVDEEDD